MSVTYQKGGFQKAGIKKACSLMRRVMLGAAVILGLQACSSGDSGVSTERDSSADASYKVTFTGLWSAADFPTGFPGSGAHFTTLIGGTHNEQVVFWEPGQPATPGIESMAEDGATAALSGEVNAAKMDGKAEFLVGGSGNIGAASVGTLEFDINETYPLITLTTMVAPSPDWFVGVHGESLFDIAAGDWKPKLVVELKVYDAGTESGVNFSRKNAEESGAIALLVSAPADTDFAGGAHRVSGKVIATITFERLK